MLFEVAVICLLQRSPACRPGDPERFNSLFPRDGTQHKARVVSAAQCFTHHITITMPFCVFRKMYSHLLGDSVSVAIANSPEEGVELHPLECIEAEFPGERDFAFKILRVRGVMENFPSSSPRLNHCCCHCFHPLRTLWTLPLLDLKARRPCT